MPFLAVAMRSDFGMGALAIGIVLGARRSMITGCIVRIAGFLLLVWAADFPLFLIGAIVTGIGGALFSPALQSLVGAAAERGPSKESAPSAGGGTDDASVKNGKGQSSRSTLFALLVICGR